MSDEAPRSRSQAIEAATSSWIVSGVVFATSAM